MKTLEQRQAAQEEMKAKNQGIPTGLVKWQFTKGVRLPNAGRKKKSDDDALMAIAGTACPDDLLCGVMEGLRGKDLTMGEALQWRMFIDGILGTKGSDAVTREIMNRLFGKVRLVVTKDVRDESVAQMTPEEIRDETLALLKRLEEFTAKPQPKKRRSKKAPTEIVSEAEASDENHEKDQGDAGPVSAS